MRFKLINVVSYLLAGGLGILFAALATSYFMSGVFSQEGGVTQPAPNINQPNPNVVVGNNPPPPPPSAPSTDKAPPPAPPSAPPTGAIPPPPATGNADSTKVEEVLVDSRLEEQLETFLAPYNYDAENRRDPFREFRLRATQQLIEEDSTEAVIGPLKPLQRFALDEIQLVGIIWDVEAPKAMFLDPNSKIHILGKDERIGRRNGYIASVREGEVVVVETVRVRGQTAFTTRLMRISTESNN